MGLNCVTEPQCVFLQYKRHEEHGCAENVLSSDSACVYGNFFVASLFVMLRTRSRYF